MTAPAPLSLTREAALAEPEVQAISDGLDAYNALFLPGYELAPKPLHLVGRDADGVLCAGARYYIAIDWGILEWLWVAAPYRRSGFGTRLLQAVEAEARASGCLGVYLDTFKFQAPDFYAKFGYSEFGRLPDCPRGFARIWLAKRFA